MFSPGARLRRAQVVAAIGLTAAFVAFTAWWLIDGGGGLDAATVRFVDWLVRGPIDWVVGALWFLGEPQFALAVVAVLALVLAVQRRYRLAAAVIGGLAVLSAAQLVVFVALAVLHHITLSVDAISHLYPSGHAARVPLLGVEVAAVAGRRVRRWVLALAVLLSISVALDRTSSFVQTGSVVIGGLLLGIAVGAWFGTLYSAWEGRTT